MKYAQRPWYKNTRGVIALFVAAFATTVLILTLASAPKDKPVEKPKPNTADLDLTVTPYTIVLEVINNEASTLENCEVQINPGAVSTGYTIRVDLAPKTPTDIPYDSFVKGDEKFDSDKYVVQNIVVSRCKGQTDRMGIYETQQ